MSIQVQNRRGTKAEHDAFTGALSEVTHNTTDNRLHAHDAVRAGGFAIPNALDIINNPFTGYVAGGTADALTITPLYEPLALSAFQEWIIEPSANNTGATTLTVGGLTVKNVKKDDGTGTLVDLEADDLKSGIPTKFIYDGVQYIVNIASAGGATSGDWEFINSYTDTSGLNNALDITDAMDTTYDEYKFEFIRARGNLDTRLYCRLGNSGGFTTTGYGSGGAGILYNVLNDTIIEFSNNTGYLGAFGDLIVKNTNSGTLPRQLQARMYVPGNGNNTFTFVETNDLLWNTTANDRIRFYNQNAAIEWLDIQINVYGKVKY